MLSNRSECIFHGWGLHWSFLPIATSTLGGKAWYNWQVIDLRLFLSGLVTSGLNDSENDICYKVLMERVLIEMKTSTEKLSKKKMLI